MAEPMDVLSSKSSDLASIEILDLDREKHEMMAETGNNALGFQITGIYEKLNRIALPEIPFSRALKRGPSKTMKRRAYLRSTRVDVGKRVFAQKIRSRGQ